MKKALSRLSFRIQILEELPEVLNRPKIKYKCGISKNDIKELLMLIEERSEPVLISNDIAICRDGDDNLIVETAIKGKATFLVTRNVAFPGQVIVQNVWYATKRLAQTANLNQHPLNGLFIEIII